MKVLFPAPLGPSKPMGPGGTWTLTSSRADCDPNFLVNASVRMTNSGMKDQGFEFMDG